MNKRQFIESFKVINDRGDRKTVNKYRKYLESSEIGGDGAPITVEILETSDGIKVAETDTGTYLVGSSGEYRRVGS